MNLENPMRAMVTLALLLVFTTAAHAAPKKKKMTAHPAHKTRPAPDDEMPRVTPRVHHVVRHNDWNFRYEPLYTALGGAGFGVDYALQENWAAGAVLTFVNYNTGNKPSGFTEEFHATSFQFGGRGTWFYNGVFKDGFYAAPA